MPLSLEQITAEALQLPVTSRAELAEKMMESLGVSEDGEIQQLWLAEAERRLDEVRSGKVKTIPGEEVMAEIRQMIGR